jgi:hypothetical protein
MYVVRLKCIDGCLDFEAFSDAERDLLMHDLSETRMVSRFPERDRHCSAEMAKAISTIPTEKLTSQLSSLTEKSKQSRR